MTPKLFPVGKPVSSEDIVDRDEFIVSLVMRLAEGQSVMLAGPRRIGKTSLALEVLQRLKSMGFYIVVVDLFRVGGKKDLAEAMVKGCFANRTGARALLAQFTEGAKKLATSVKLSVALEDFRVEFGLPYLTEDEDEILKHALELPEKLALRDGKKIVILFDEFQEASSIAGPDIYKLMRAYFQSQQRSAYFFLGSQASIMRELFGSRKHALYRFAQIFAIPPVPKQAWVSYIAAKFASRDIQTEETLLERMVDLTGGHPQDVMLLCSEVYYVLLDVAKSTVTRGVVDVAYQRTMEMLTPLFSEMWVEAGAKKRAREILFCLAEENKPYLRLHPNEVKRILDWLVKQGFIEKEGRGKYVFTEPMFAAWLLKYK
ncbi:MAG: AAA family ATPase [Dethiobacter sp.]|jgi:AAA+ ATPase superfamily predicted ATPase|nr:AAA family ATPase [Dethiobacter sp.]